MQKLLIANRGEIAIRIMHAAAELGIETVAIYSEDDAEADTERIVEIATQTGCDAVHPGYGFLSENAAFARTCDDAGSVFVGPTPETLDLFGDKAKARALAKECGVPRVPGTDGATSREQAHAFFTDLGPDAAMMIKAVVGGGGRGMRVVRAEGELDEAYERCRSEAEQAFGCADVYVERFTPRVRHIEVQILGDGTGAVTHLWERECSIQRRNQKIVEIAPSPSLGPGLREKLIGSAVRLAREARYRNLGTFEFLVDAEDAARDDATFAFIEANPRLQVEHTVTEQVTGIDLVKLQLELASGATLADLGLEEAPAPRGYALQLRINMETIAPDGTVKPSGGMLSAFEIPFGPGIRVDTSGFVGYRTNPSFDSLLAKLIGYSASTDYRDAIARAYRALCEFKIEGVSTNIPFLQNLLRHEAFVANDVHTQFVDRHAEALAGPADAHRKLYVDRRPAPRRAGAKVDAVDPLAVLDYGRSGIAEQAPVEVESPVPAANPLVVGPEGTEPLLAPMQGTIVSVTVTEGDAVRPGQQVLIMEAMKMEHVIDAEVGGIVRRLAVQSGDTVYQGDPLAFVEAAEIESEGSEAMEDVDLDYIRPDLAESLERHRLTLDGARPQAVARRRKTGQRTARENIDDLVDPGTLTEYGALTIAARRRRHTIDELIERTPADGLIAGVALINSDRVPPEKARCVVISYDYTVLAGTQGKKNHEKKDRIFEVAKRRQLPLVFFCEGGGGRPGDTDVISAGSLHITTFHQFAELSGLVPLVGITSGRCFAGNAVLLGCCDVIIATANSNIGMGGPAMIEGGGLGVFRPEEVGPMSEQVPNGVVDIAVADEAEAVAVAKKYVSYFQGPISGWECADQRWLRRAVPENRLRVYDVRKAIATLADTDSVLELRPQFGVGMITAFARVEGRPLGIIANNPRHLGGAIDSPAADKAARFMQICDAFDIPLLFLCDTPGNMVGPEAEKAALVRHCCRVFVIGANLTVPFFTVVLRKAYGLGAQGMGGAGFHNPLFTIAWPTGEFGGMGLEGAVKLGFRDQLAAIEDPAERKEAYEKMVDEAYERGKAISTASLFEIDDVIDPADTRRRARSTRGSTLGEPTHESRRFPPLPAFGVVFRLRRQPVVGR
jgi:acetyl/propionyl-CoA carboxylase alpha subunit